VVCDERYRSSDFDRKTGAIAVRAGELGISLEGFSFVDHQDEARKDALIAAYLSMSES
jgi:2-phospho-L-lactate guanylyltransferase (CobY/MobA/RfbA family)